MNHLMKRLEAKKLRSSSDWPLLVSQSTIAKVAPRSLDCIVVAYYLFLKAAVSRPGPERAPLCPYIVLQAAKTSFAKPVRIDPRIGCCNLEAPPWGKRAGPQIRFSNPNDFLSTLRGAPCGALPTNACTPTLHAFSSTTLHMLGPRVATGNHRFGGRGF